MLFNVSVLQEKTPQGWGLFLNISGKHFQQRFVSFQTGVEKFILYSVTCGTLRSTLTTVWPRTAHLRSSRRSHSVWCLICNLLICSAWVCFSSWVTRTWSGKKRRLVRKNLESNNSTPTSSAHTERQRGFLHFENKIVPMCIPMSQEAGVDSAELTIMSCTHYHHVGLAR